MSVKIILAERQNGKQIIIRISGINKHRNIIKLFCF